MINKVEAIGILLTIGAMALVLFVTRIDSNIHIFGSSQNDAQPAAAIVSTTADGSGSQSLPSTLQQAMNGSGKVNSLVVDDITVGTGAAVKDGDKVTVNYIGTLQNGQQFDNSYTKGTPFSFTVGAGEVIKGWDEGIVGMKVGGQRILVVPSDLAYGNAANGPIPANATLVFAIELEKIE